MLKPDTLDGLAPVTDADCVETYRMGHGMSMLTTRDAQGEVDLEVRMPAKWVTPEIADRVLAFARAQRELCAHQIKLRLHR